MFSNKKFDVESALLMHADDFAIFPATALYNEAMLKKLEFATKRCHIYLVGFVPTIDLLHAKQTADELTLEFTVAGNRFDIILPIPGGSVLESDSDGWKIALEDGTKVWPSNDVMQQALKAQTNAMDFDVQYIGQAYGQAGERNAIDRLLEHKTLQKIAVKGTPQHHELYVITLGIQSGNRQAFMFNPNAQDTTQGEERIEESLNKLFDTSEAEQISLYEAALIRHFQPPFNKTFKNSFPSTNLKLLADCYKRDFSAVCAEIGFDGLPFALKSGTVPASDHVIAPFHLHDDAARKAFFFSD